MNDHHRIFSGLLPQQNWNLASARKRGDWKHLQSLVEKGKDNIIQTVWDSGLRGRGGAGFLTGKKWTFMPSEPHPDRPHYLVVNADESEPGTCKDRLILLHEPHKILEGIVYACRAINAHTCFVYIRGEYDAEYKRLAKALAEARIAGLIGDDCGGSGWSVDIILHRGAGAYICGEEMALLESLEGGRGMPRIKPPFPSQSGLYGCPTTINNVESIAVIPTILRRGAHWFSSLGTEKSTGTRLFCISGDVNKPCVIEEEMGISLKKLITEYANDVIGGWHNLLAIIPGGSSSKMLPRSLCQDISMDFETLDKAGSSLGTAGIIVINKDRDIIQAIERISAFYMHESCGQCTPCREGTGWLWRILSRIRKGQGKKDDIHQLQRIAKHVENSTICALGPAAAFPLQALIEHFSSTMEERCLAKNEKKIS